MVDKVFLTDARRNALNNYDPSDSNHRGHKSRVLDRARVALDELVWVAAHPEIENADVFEEERIYALLRTLLAGSGGVIGADDDADLPADGRATEPDPDHRNSIYVAVSKAQHYAERDSDLADIYEMFGERAASLEEYRSE